jgi:cytoskeleton protein RodZ
MLETLGIGASLREQRIRRGLSLEAVEQATRIRRRYLEAVEDERWDELPAEAYAKGFVRTYAAYLELDPQQFLAEFRSRRREVEEAIAPHAQLPYEPMGLRWPAAGLAAAGVLALVLFVGAWKLSGDAATPSAPAAAPTTTAASKPAPAAPTRAATPVARPLRLTAMEDSWVEVRRASARGKLVWTGTLRRGRTLTLGLRRPLWLELGRPTVVKAAVGRKAIAVPDATAMVATPKGLRAA